MALDLWFREDVARILASTQEAMQNSLGALAPLDPEAADLYQRGFADAVRALAIAFGVCPADSLRSARREHRPPAVQIVDGGAAPVGSNGPGRRRYE
jgi:hypothetical protein